MRPSNQAWRDVVVVGAGLAGSSVAVALAGQGWDVLLVERERLPRHKVCGEFLSPEAQRSLRQLGLYAELEALAPVPLSGAVLTTSRGATLELRLPGEAWGLSRYALDATLAVTAARRGAELWPATTVTACTRQNDRYTLNLRRRDESTTIEARAVIMACGRYNRPGLPSRPAPTDKPHTGWRRCVGLKCHYEQVAMPPQVELFLFPGGYAGINPIEGGRANVCLLLTYDAFNRSGKTVAGAIAMAAARHSLLAQRLAGANAVTGTECAVAPVDTQRPAQPWTDVACLGDTAVMIPPLCGDGMAMALSSAELCAPLADAFLRGNLSLAGWAEAYSRVWQAEFNRRLRLGRSLQSLLSTPLVGEALVGLGRWLPGLADYMVRATRGDVSAKTPLNLESG